MRSNSISSDRIRIGVTNFHIGDSVPKVNYPAKKSQRRKADSELFEACFILFLQGKRHEAAVARRRLRARLIPVCLQERNAKLAIALGDIALQSQVRYKYYRLASLFEPDNSEALSHLALEAARRGRDAEARRTALRAIGIGFEAFPEIEDILLSNLILTAHLLGDDRLMAQVRKLGAALPISPSEVARELRWRRKHMLRRRRRQRL